MSATVKKMNWFLRINVPVAYLCGLRLITITKSNAAITVKLNWLNKNPFKSIYFAVQSMAAELSTGVMVLDKINESGKKVSMLVTNYSGRFTKKAVGRIIFVCKDGLLIERALKNTLETGEAQTIEMNSVGTDEAGDQVSAYTFQWSIRLKK
jgi:hypothetical protein